MLSQNFYKFPENRFLGMHLRIVALVEQDVCLYVSLSSYMENLQLTSSITS